MQPETLFRPLTISSQLRRATDFLRELPVSLLSDAIAEILTDLDEDVTADEAMLRIHRAQRLYYIAFMGLQDNEDVVAAFHDTTRYPLWDRYVALAATEDQKNALARLMYEGDPKREAPIAFTVSDYGRDVAERVVLQCVRDEADVDIVIEDPVFMRRLYLLVAQEDITRFGKMVAQRHEKVQRRIQLVGSHTSIPFADPEPSVNVTKAYRDGYITRMHSSVRNQFYTLTRLPTPQAAALDGIAYDDYVDLFFRMCALDWSRMDTAHRILIDTLNKGSILRITNNDGTDVTMDIGGFTFANSLVAKNVPGSEVFSAPRRDSVNGKIVAKGRFLPRDTADMVENITLHFENGRLVHFDAEKGFEHLQSFLSADEGALYVGEIGIGTNPVLQQHVVNSLMVEKIGGSFHVALGAAYEYTDYLGEPVILDNGNRSKIHWDITTMLVGKEGMMYLDGAIIMRDGKFTDPALAYLNAAN